MKLNKKMSSLNEAVCKGLGIDTDEKIAINGVLDNVTADAANEEIERIEATEEALKDSTKNAEEFVEMNHNREVKPEKTDSIKKMKLSESLFDDAEEDEVLEEDTSDPVDVVDIAVDNVIENIMSGELGNLAQQIAALGKGYDAAWCSEDANSPTSQGVVKALEVLSDALKADLLANYNVKEELVESPVAIAEPETKKRARGANEVKQKGDYSSEDLWLAVYDELSSEVDNEGDGQQVDKQIKARKGERYEEVYPSGTNDIVVYAPSLDKFDFARKVADYYGVECDEPKEDKNATTNGYYRYSMVIRIPEDELFDWE